MLLNFKNESGDLLTLQLKKGNNKPVPKSIYIINLESAKHCSSSKYCKFHRLNGGNCYAWKNEKQFKETTTRAEKDRQTINYIIKNNMVEELADEIIKASQRSIKHPMEALRIAERGDLPTYNHLLFINQLADIIYNKCGVYTTLYTHRQDYYIKFMKEETQSKGLIIIGSGFNADINFKALTPRNTNADLYCCSNCSKCQSIHKIPLCYDPALKGQGLTIGEPLRDQQGRPAVKIFTDDNSAPAAKAAPTAKEAP